MNSENSKTLDPHRLLLNLTDKIDLRRKDKFIALSIHGQYLLYTWTNIKNHIRIKNLKCQLRHGMKNLNYLMDHTLYQTFKIILNIYLKKHGEKSVDPAIKVYVNKLENRITFKIKNGYYL